MKAILAFFDFWTIFFSFSFHFCFDLPQVSNCFADGGLITGAGKAYDSGRVAMTADGKLITGAGKAYDSGRGAFCVRFGFFFFL